MATTSQIWWLTASQDRARTTLFFGRNANDTPFTNITTSQIQAPDGFVVTGSSGLPGITGRLSGPISVGDVNGDQIGDIIQNSPFGSPKEVAVVFGQSQNTTTTRALTSIVDGTNGFLLTGNGFSTISSSSADINNDGAADILLGDSFSSLNGKVGIIFGRNPSLPPPPALNATNSMPLEIGQGGELQLNSTITSRSTATNTTGSALAIDNSSSIGGLAKRW